MGEERTSFIDEDFRNCLCADAGENGVLISSFMNGNEDAQVALAYDEARRLGEWLIERANQAGEK